MTNAANWMLENLSGTFKLPNLKLKSHYYIDGMSAAKAAIISRMLESEYASTEVANPQVEKAQVAKINGRPARVRPVESEIVDYRGVVYCRIKKLWRARATKEGARFNVGHYLTQAEAIEAHKAFMGDNKKQPLQGTYKHQTSGKFCAKIMINKKRVHLGSYETEVEAHMAYMSARRANVARA